MRSLLLSVILSTSAVSPATVAAVEKGSPTPVLRTTPGHPIQYWVARPKAWRAGERYPVLVAIPDATKQWEVTVGDFARAADAQNARFVVVTPLVVTNGSPHVDRIRPAYPYDDATWARIGREGRCHFDLEGTEAVLRDVTARDGGEGRVFVAGVEAAAHTVFALAFRRPGRVRAAVVASGNWAGRCLSGEDPGPFSDDAARATLALRTFDIEGEGGVLSDQQAHALVAARDHGFALAAPSPQRLASRADVPRAAVAWFASLLTP